MQVMDARQNMEPCGGGRKAKTVTFIGLCFLQPRNSVRRGNNYGLNYYEGDREASRGDRIKYRGKTGAKNSKVTQHQTKKSQAQDQIYCDELLFCLVRTPLALLAQSSDVSYNPNTHISPASPSCQLRHPEALMFLHVFHMVFSTVQVLQAYFIQGKTLSPSGFLPWQHEVFDKKKAMDWVGSFKPIMARKATDR